jgi:hypothetical protein
MLAEACRLGAILQTIFVVQGVDITGPLAGDNFVSKREIGELSIPGARQIAQMAFL